MLVNINKVLLGVWKYGKMMSLVQENQGWEIHAETREGYRHVQRTRK